MERSVARVLVVDDQPSVAAAVARWLEREGMRCAVAHSRAEALARAAVRPFDLVLTDVHMPGGSGLDLGREMKRQDPDLQVIIMTGSGTVETAIEALRLGADDYLLKPLDFAALAHAARRALEHRRLLQENRDYGLHLERRVREQGQRLERLYLSGIHSLVKALEAKDPHTCGHSERVVEYSVALAGAVGRVDLETVRIAAQLHDIGKIGITGDILRKEGPLSAEEVLAIRRHPSIGVQILRPMLEDREILDIVHHHHERWDGDGYPNGLSGESIPMGARIIAVADAFDAMTTSRPYRGARSPEQAVDELERESGRQFDPAVVRHAGAIFLGAAELVS